MKRLFLLSPPTVLALAALFGALIWGCGGSTDESSSAGASGDDATFLLANFTTLSELGLDGSRRVIANAGPGAFILYPALSPDGKEIAFSRQQSVRPGPDGIPDYGADIYLVPRAGGEARELIHHPAPGQYLGSAMWADRGKQLLYSVRGPDRNGQPDLYIASYDFKSGVSRRVISDATEPSLSPDGKEVVFVTLDSSLTTSELAISRIDGSNRRLIVPDSAGLTAILSPVFAPDGKRIAFAAQEKEEARLNRSAGPAPAHPGTHEVYIVNRDGSELGVFAELDDINPSLTWSGDGEWLYILATAGIWKIRANGENLTRVQDGIGNAQFVWLPKDR